MTQALSSRQRTGRRMINGIAVLAMLYLFAPIFMIVLFSFNSPKGKFNIVWNGFTLDNWANPFASSELTDALLVSLRVAFISTICATILGSMIALSLSRYKFKGSGVVNLFLVLPLTSPEIVLGSSLATLFLARSVEFGYLTVVIAHIMFQVSFVAVTVRARIRGFDWTLEQAALDLGASPQRAFWKITFPLLLPGIMAAALLAFALSFDDFIITYFNSGPTETFPKFVYTAAAKGLPGEANVIGMSVFFLAIAIVVTVQVRSSLKAKRLARTK